MKLVTSCDTTEQEFRLQMKCYCPGCFSDSALNLIYDHIVSREKLNGCGVYTPLQIQITHAEYTYKAAAEKFGIPLGNTSSLIDFENMATEYFGEYLVGFTVVETTIVILK